MGEQKKGGPAETEFILYFYCYCIRIYSYSTVYHTLKITGMFRKLNHLVKIQFSDKTDSILHVVIYAKFWLFRLFNILTCIALTCLLLLLLLLVVPKLTFIFYPYLATNHHGGKKLEQFDTSCCSNSFILHRRLSSYNAVRLKRGNRK